MQKVYLVQYNIRSLNPGYGYIYGGNISSSPLPTQSLHEGVEYFTNKNDAENRQIHLLKSAEELGIKAYTSVVIIEKDLK